MYTHIYKFSFIKQKTYLRIVSGNILICFCNCCEFTCSNLLNFFLKNEKIILN